SPSGENESWDRRLGEPERCPSTGDGEDPSGRCSIELRPQRPVEYGGGRTALDPDGRSMAFALKSRDGKPEIFLRHRGRSAPGCEVAPARCDWEFELGRS